MNSPWHHHVCPSDRPLKLPQRPLPPAGVNWCGEIQLVLLEPRLTGDPPPLHASPYCQVGGSRAGSLRRRMQRVSADTLPRVAAAILVRGRLHGRRATAVAVVLTVWLHRELAFPTDPVGAADAEGLLTGQLLLLMLLPSPGGEHLANQVEVGVGVVVMLLLQVGGAIVGFGAPPKAWH